MLLAATDGFSMGALAMGLLGGLCVFLFGMSQLTDAVKAVAGRGMKTLLSRLTTGRFRSALTGALVTAVFQSSTVTTVLAVGFVSTGLLTLTQAIGIIMGAHVGTTVTAQIIAFKVTKYALALVAVGYGVRVFIRTERSRQVGMMLFGLGLLFLGMELMMTATEPLRGQPAFIDFLGSLDHPLLGIIMGTLVTALVHSSAATTGVVIVLASRGLITLEAGIAIVLGANIGTCVTAILAALGKGRDALRAALAHLSFSVVGVILWAWFVPQLSSIVRAVSPPDAPRQIANAHTLFNFANLLLLIWFTAPLAALLRRLVPDRPEKLPEIRVPKYLDPGLLGTPELALRSAALELGRLGDHARGMLSRLLPAVLRGGPRDLDRLALDEEDLEALYAEILRYLRQVSLRATTTAQADEIGRCVSVLNHIQNIGRTIQTSFGELGRDRLKREVEVSPVTADVLAPLFAKVLDAFDLSLAAMAGNDREMAERVLGFKDAIHDLSARAKAHLLDRLSADAPNRQWTFRIETDIVENLKRLYYFEKRIAKAVLGEFEAAEGRAGPAGS
jgi:phosphate:Na+ symporter